MQRAGRAFAWQVGYAAYSVSESVTDQVYQYILNQKHHHRQRNFQEEYEALLALHEING